eukprot:Lankesteria_metandrocarpae@DN2701_c0_g1_i1.p1
MRKELQSGEMKVAVIGDEDTVVGFLMAGVGSRDGMGRTNFLIVGTRTRKTEIEDAFKSYTQERKDIGVLIINQHIADSMRYLVDLHEAKIPTILEVPSKDKVYDASKDSVMQRVKVFFGGSIPDA